VPKRPRAKTNEKARGACPLFYGTMLLVLVGETGLELGVAEEKTSGMTPTCGGYAELWSLCSSA
jgi:hypothetical protein